tara:strand:- start:8465 stop:9211 length:747 start_codon:yes stop_codon:yes gene_type:complete
MTLPVNDPQAVVVNSKDELVKVHNNHPSVEVCFWPEYNDVPAFAQCIIERLATLKIDFSFSIKYESYNKNYDFYIEEENVSQLAWCNNIQNLLSEHLNVAQKEALDFIEFLIVELKSYLQLLPQHYSTFATFTTSRHNLKTHKHGAFWHCDSNPLVGIKNYIGEGALYANKRAVLASDSYVFNTPLSDSNNFLTVDKRYNQYQIKTQGVSLHKGGSSFLYDPAAVHKSPVKVGSTAPRVVLLFGVSNY